MKSINYEPYIVDGLLVSLRKLFKEELGYRENTVEVERYVSNMRKYLEENSSKSDWQTYSNELIEKYR
jgi:hypothetical protein